MCGLAGIVSWNERFPVDRATLDEMSARVAPRGPHGQGVYLNHDDRPLPARPQCGLVHRRMAIIDIDERSLQPMDDGHFSKWIVYNGEVYNYRELRADLEQHLRNWRWRTESDTEVLLAALSTWETRALERVSGMLALAMWDQTEHKLLLARDRMGQKPLFFAAVDADGRPWRGFVSHDAEDVQVEIHSNAACPAAIAFASELSALRCVPWFDSSVDYYALAEYLRWGYIPGGLTIYRGACKVPPATWMRFSARGCEREQYFDPNPPLNRDNRPNVDPVAETRSLVLRAVGRQLVADVPIGCFLSGGVDSSIVAAAMKQAVQGQQEIRTFTIGFDDPRYDETAFAAEVARHLGTRHEQFVVKPDAAKDLPRLAEVFGEPFGDSSALPTHYLSRETRKFVKVALSGDGGDELFGGYDRYRAMQIAENIRNLPVVIREVVAARLWQALPGSHPKGKISRLKRLLRTARSDPPERYSSYVRLFDEPTLQPLLGIVGGLVPTVDSVAAQYERLRNGRDIVQAALATDRETYLPDDLLTKVDRASMLHALEVRAPFMDEELVGFAANLPTDQLLERGGKRLLRQAFANDLPAAVFERPKMGFALPIGQWLCGELREMLHDLLFAGDSFLSQNMVPAEARRLVAEHDTGRRDHSQRLYALLMLELWARGEKR